MTESELYKNLGILTKGKDQWEENIAETDIRQSAIGAYRWRVGGPPHLGVGAHPFGLQR